MSFGTWNEFFTSVNRGEDGNFAVKDLVELLAPAEPEDCMSNLLEFDSLSALTIYLSTDELVIIHHISKVSRFLKKSKKSEKIVVLCGMGSVA